MENIILETERFRLRFFSINDAKTVAKLCNNVKIYNNTLTLPQPYGLSDALEWIEYLKVAFDPDRSITFAITNKETNEVLGSIGIELSQIHKRAEIGYWLGEDYWNQGIMTECVKRVIEYIFEERNYNKVTAQHFTFNIGSGKVMIKAGMTYEGCLREHIKKGDSYYDLACYGLLKSEYEKNK